MSSLCGSLDNKPPTVTWNFKMAGIFQDGHHCSEAIKWYKGLFDDASMKIGMNSLCGSLDNKQPTAIWNFKMAAIFQDGHHLREHWSDIIVYLVIQAWKLPWAVSKAHLTRKCPQSLKFQDGGIFLRLPPPKWSIRQYNCLVSDTSMLIVMISLWQEITSSHLKFLFSRWRPTGSSKDPFSHRNVCIFHEGNFYFRLR